MHISFCGRYRHCGYSTLVNADISYADRSSSDEPSWPDYPAIKVYDTELIVRAKTKPNPNSHMAGSYVVEVRLTETEIANLAVALWGSGAFESVIDALSKRTERGKRVGQIERWRRHAVEASSKEERDSAERQLRRSVDKLPKGTAADN